nr:hypothetical protein [Frankia sp. QA3]
MGEAKVFDDGDGGGVVRADGGADAVEPEGVEAEVDEGADGVGGVAVAPVVGVEGVAEFCGLDAAQVEAGEADQGAGVADGEVELGAGLLSGALDDAGEHRVGLLAGLGVEGQVVGDAPVPTRSWTALASSSPNSRSVTVAPARWRG